MARCVLIANTSHRLFDGARNACLRAFDTVDVIDHRGVDRVDLESRQYDLLVSFLSEFIVPGSLLSRPSINLHPAPPCYPGRGGASRAIFDGASSYGATVHTMVQKVDRGSILGVSEFPIGPNDGCEILFERAERECLSLLDRIMDNWSAHGQLPPPTDHVWSGETMSRKQFLQWLTLDQNSPTDVIERKIRAARHSKYSGPFIVVNGHRFAYAPS